MSVDNPVFWALARVGEAERHLQKLLVTMRQTCQQIEQSGVQPQRNPTLDDFLHKIERAGACIAADLHYLTNENSLRVDDEPVFANAHGILRDVNEIIELIVWLGGKRSSESGFQDQRLDLKGG